MLLILGSIVSTVPLVQADPTQVLLNYGGLGIAFALVILGRLHTSGEVRVLEKQVDALTVQLNERIETIKAKDALIEAAVAAISKNAIPALSESSRVLENIPGTESALASLLRESMAQTAALTARLSGEDLGQQTGKAPDA